jgi:hypothetical protein
MIKKNLNTTFFIVCVILICIIVNNYFLIQLEHPNKNYSILLLLVCGKERIGIGKTYFGRLMLVEFLKRGSKVLIDYKGFI